MHRTEGANHASNLFTDGPPGTTVEEDHLNAVQEELANLVEKAGLSLKSASTETRIQLEAALTRSMEHRAKFIWDDADEIFLDPGRYSHLGTVEQMVFWNTRLNITLSGAGASTWYYVYIDDSAIITADTNQLTASEFIFSSAVPTWNDAKHGWYNGNDRCIFAVLTDGGNNILEFFHESDFVLFADRIATRAAATLTTNFADITALTRPVFSREARIMINSLYVSTGGGNGGVSWRTNGQGGATGHSVGLINADVKADSVSVRVITDPSGVIEMKEGLNTDYTYSVDTTGWYFPVGM